MKNEACSIGREVILKLVHSQKGEDNKDPFFDAEGQKTMATTLDMPRTEESPLCDARGTKSSHLR